MRVFDLKISEKAVLTCYISGESREMPNYVRDAMLVLPGGGYEFCSDREAEPIAKKYFAAGMNCFVLRYSIGADAAGFQPLVEASLSVKYIRDNAKEYNINPDRIFAVGFSAGGHLCAALGSFWNAPWLLEKLDIPYGSNKPNGTVVSYGVISSGRYGHRNSFHQIMGTNNPDEELLDRYSVEKHITADSAPAFIWATSDDGLVPVQNSLMLAEGFADAGLKFELHIFPHGPHGISIAEPETAYGNPELVNESVAAWIPLSITWIRNLK